MTHLTSAELNEIQDTSIIIDLLLWVATDRDNRKPEPCSGPVWEYFGGWMVKQGLISQKCVWDGAEEKMEYSITENGESYLQSLIVVPVPNKDGVVNPPKEPNLTNEKFATFVYKIRPRLNSGELQTLAHFAEFLKSGDESKIPGNN